MTYLRHATYGDFLKKRTLYNSEYLQIAARTNTPIIGLEEEVQIHKSINHVRSLSYHLKYGQLKEDISDVEKAFKDMITHYDGKGTDAEKQTFAEVKSGFQHYLDLCKHFEGKVKDLRDITMARSPANTKEEIKLYLIEIKKGIPAGQTTWGKRESALSINSRNRTWINKAKKYKRILVVGGANHTLGFKKYAVQERCAIISLYIP